MAGDILIKNGTIIDGTGAPAQRGDIYLSQGRIVHIGGTFKGKAETIIDATDLIVAPGFVDILNHSDVYLTILKNPESESLIRQGITTAILGNCGTSLAPIPHGRLIRVVQKWADIREVNVDWERFSEFLGAIERLRPAMNAGSLVGHSTIRRAVLGDEARDPTDNELKKMGLLLEGALQEGAFGLSFAPQYVHARGTSEREIDMFASHIAKAQGYLAVHLRDVSGEIEVSLREAVGIAERTKVALELSHLKPYGEKADRAFPDLLRIIDEAATRGIDVHFDIFPWQMSFIVLYLLFPVWAQEGGLIAMRKRLLDTPTAKRVFDELKRRNIPWDHYILAETKNLSDDIGKTITECAKRHAVSPEELVIRLFIRHEGRVLLFRDTKDRTALRKALTHPRALIASVGGGYSHKTQAGTRLVHPRSFGAMPKFLSKFVLHEKLMSLEEGIAKITSRPAAKIGLRDRGALAKGKAADVVAFNPKTLFNRATIESPYQYPAGIEWVIVNGEIAVNPDGVTGVRAGQLLRRNAAS